MTALSGAQGARLGERILAVFRRHGGETVRLRDALAEAGVPVSGKGYNAGVHAVHRLERKGEIVSVGHGLYQLSEALSPKELRRRLADALPLAHGVKVLSAQEHDLSSLSAAREFFARRGGLLGGVEPSAKGVMAGNKLLWRVPTNPARSVLVAAHSGGLEADFSCTDDPLSPGGLKAYSEILGLLTGVVPDEWTVAQVGINKDLVGTRLDGFRAMQVSLGELSKEIVRVYEHPGAGVRFEVHLAQTLPLATVLAVLHGGSWAVEQQLRRAEALAVQMAATQAAQQRLQAKLISALTTRERATAKRCLKNAK